MDTPAGDKGGAAPAVVGALSIGGESPSKLGRLDNECLIPYPIQLELGDQALQSVVNLAQLAWERHVVIAVGVETRKADKEGVALRTEGGAPLDDARDIFALPPKNGIWKVGHGGWRIREILGVALGVVEARLTLSGDRVAVD